MVWFGAYSFAGKCGGDVMRFLSLGAGAIGGYFGGRLVEGGADVTFLVRERRKAELSARGLKIESRFGSFSSPVLLVTAAEARGEPWDVIFVTCKAYDLPSAIDTLRLVMGSSTAILPFLNGLDHIEVLNGEFGRERVLGGLAKIAATLRADGVIEHLNDWREITFGEQNGEMSSRVKAIKAAFDETSVLASAVPNIMQSMWEKLVHLATVAGMTSLMRSAVGEIASVPAGSEMLIKFLEMNAAIASQEGFPISEAFLHEYRELFHDTTSTYKASMLRDMERNGPIEADHIFGFLLDRAARHGLDLTMHRLVYTNLKAYEARLMQRLSR
jgi:2-dehydropantoate 2-reductase